MSSHRIYPPGTPVVSISDEDPRWPIGKRGVVREHNNYEVCIAANMNTRNTYTYLASRLSGSQSYPQIFKPIHKPTIIIIED